MSIESDDDLTKYEDLTYNPSSSTHRSWLKFILSLGASWLMGTLPVAGLLMWGGMALLSLPLMSAVMAACGVALIGGFVGIAIEALRRAVVDNAATSRGLVDFFLGAGMAFATSATFGTALLVVAVGLVSNPWVIGFLVCAAPLLVGLIPTIVGLLIKTTTQTSRSGCFLPFIASCLNTPTVSASHTKKTQPQVDSDPTNAAQPYGSGTSFSHVSPN